jgi:hypothetical protein
MATSVRQRSEAGLEVADVLLFRHHALGEVADDAVPVGVLGEQTPKLRVEIPLWTPDNDSGVAERRPNGAGENVPRTGE